MAGHERRKGEGGAARAGQPAAPVSRTAPASKAPRKREADTDAPGLNEAKEFARSLVIAEKNYLLYPVKGKVVQRSLEACLGCLQKVFEASGAGLALEVTQFELTYAGESVYHDENPTKSIAYRLSKDSIRQLDLLPGMTLEELSGFLSCFKESQKLGDTEEDFSTVFWEKDLKHVQIDIAANFVEEWAVDVPVPRGFCRGFEPSRFKVDAAAEKRIEELIADRRARESGTGSAFDLTAEERERLQAITSDEKLYFPLYDFVDVLIEVMVQEQDAKGFAWALKLIRTAVFALIENLDFEHACGLLDKLLGGKRHGLTPAHHLRLAEMAGSLTDKATMDVIRGFLAESSPLPHDHEVFRLMQRIGSEGVPRFCELMTLPAHIPAVTKLLIQLGKDYGELFARYLLDPDPQVVRAMIQVLLETDRDHAVERISVALGHSDEATRLLAARTMSEGRDGRAGQYFIRLLSGESRPLLHLAIGHFAQVPCAAAFEELRGIIGAARFHALDEARQDQCFKALLLADPQRAMDFICGQVLRWRPSLHSKSRRRKASALRALALEPTERSLEVLGRFAAWKRGDLGRVARQLLGSHARKARKEEVSRV